MKILVLGSNGSLAQVVVSEILKKTNWEMILYSKSPSRIQVSDNERMEFIQADVMDTEILQDQLKKVDLVYANLSGNLVGMAQILISSMQKTDKKRLIWISSMGIYNEIENEPYQSILDPYRDSATLIEKSDLNYTIIRPAWFSYADEIDYGITLKGEKFKNPQKQISRRSIADLIIKIIQEKDFAIRESVGIHHQ